MKEKNKTKTKSSRFVFFNLQKRQMFCHTEKKE